MPFRPLRGYFYLYLHSTLILHNNNIVLRSPQLRETLYHFNSTSTSFPFVPRPYISHIDLAPSIFRCFSSHFINFAPISFVLSLYTSDYVYRPPHSFTFNIRSFSGRILTIYHLISLIWPYRNCLPELCTY